ncbi:zinc metalloprotease [Ornithinimicrobium sp. F0845]|uniref:zinc metalloprotease n=1 Tax=Ornithinimicrobium sp. F0845 TaxID=2926412 RepID=UPI001FF48FBA|nr:zinc metalloprotease [Ornithinimicrobium sp. F0845]MCK0112454.1 zinc metalloprotease [Ornithinimicrobium sp. F0845]
MTSPMQGDDHGGGPAEPFIPATRTCATDRVHERLLREVPGYAERRATCENQAWRAERGAGTAGRAGVTTIPVVVHVVHRTDEENISEEQIASQLETLNADFRNLNLDGGTVPAPFAGLRGDARVGFELATTDPAGNPSDGITRTRTTVEGFTDDDAVKAAATGGADAWPADHYLNVWVAQLAAGLLGYAQFPGGPDATDGVVITHTACGSTGTATAPFNLGRTATHEVGHWLNLRHIWGDDGTGCHGTDFVDDTPNQGGPNTGKPLFPVISCNNAPDGDLFMNYMDYVDDDSMMMFTHGQVTRMQVALEGMRPTIGTVSPVDEVSLRQPTGPPQPPCAARGAGRPPGP